MSLFFKNCYRSSCVFLLWSILYAPAGAEIKIIDDADNVVMLEVPAQRIISLAPHITELLFAAGAGGQVVGVSAFSDYPAAARGIQRISGGSGLDIEAILSLEPDLVIAWQSGNPAAQVSRLRSLGLVIYLSEPRQLEDISSTLRNVGRLTGHEVIANQQAAEYDRRLVSLRERYSGQKKVSVFYQIWHQPMMTVNGKHLNNAVIELCGGRNIFSGLSALAPQVSTEAVLAANPEVIVGVSNDKSMPAWLEQWRDWPVLAAVKNNHIYTLPRDLMVRHTPRILDGAERLCRLLENVRNE